MLPPREEKPLTRKTLGFDGGGGRYGGGGAARCGVVVRVESAMGDAEGVWVRWEWGIIFTTKFSLKSVSAGGGICLFCHMTSVGRLEIMIHNTPFIICGFHFPVDFRLDILFPHIFWFLHQN